MFYEVPLIPQCNTATCWWACEQMIRRWAQVRSSPHTAAQVQQFGQAVCSQNLSIRVGTPGAVDRIAQATGFRTARGSLTPEGWEQLLAAYGPLMYLGRTAGYRGISGAGHAVVVRGITDLDTLLINDPWEPGVGLQLSMAVVTFGMTFPRDDAPILHI